MSLLTGLLARNEAKKTRKAQEAANEEMETRATEAAALNDTKDDPGADIVFGAARESKTLLARTKKKKSEVTGAVGSIGGLGVPSGFSI